VFSSYEGSSSTSSVGSVSITILNASGMPSSCSSLVLSFSNHASNASRTWGVKRRPATTVSCMGGRAREEVEAGELAEAMDRAEEEDEEAGRDLGEPAR
jgi:hypothetical protein